MEKGTVKFFDAKKGYGFITPKKGGKDVFVHFSNIKCDGYKELDEHDEVEFETERTDRGMSAINVKRI